MSYIPVTQSRRSRRKNKLIVNRKIAVSTMLAMGVFSFIQIFPVLPLSLILNTSTVIALFTLLLFGSTIVGLTFRLLILIRNRLTVGKHALGEIQAGRRETASHQQAESMVIDEPRLQKTFFRGLEAVLSIGAWAFFLHLMQPFISAIVWWQGYKLMEGRAFSLATIEGIYNLIESSVYYGIIVFLILFFWSRWNYYRYGRLNRRKPKPLVSNTDLAVFYDVPLATVKEAQSVKAAHVDVGPGFVNFQKIDLDNVKKVCVYVFFSLLLFFPSQSMAATFSTSMSVLGYDQDVIVTGAKTNLSVAFPVPRVMPLAGSAVNLVVEPGKNLNDASNFSFYMNDRQIATFSAGQLRAKPNVQLPISTDVINRGQAQVGIVANVFVTNDICSDYQRGNLFYTVRNSSALTMQFQPPSPKTIPEFFNTLTNGLLIIIPDNPTFNEIATGAWSYGILQKKYPYVPVKLIFASERMKYPGIPRIWVGLHNHLPASLAGFTQGIHLPFPDTLVIAAQDDDNLQTLVKQIAQLAVIEAMPSSNISVSNEKQPSVATQDKIYFGNNTAQEGIQSVPVDFDIYPAMFSVTPKSLNIHLAGRYGPSNITGKQVRLDVFFNRKLIHSELLDDSGVLNKEIAMPKSLDLKAKNALSLVFEYPEEKGYCKVNGMAQSVQVLQSSYVSGVDKISASRFTWPNIGLLFNKNGLILLNDIPASDIIRSVGEMVLFMNNQLPPGMFAYPNVDGMSQFSSSMNPDYLVVLGLAQEMPNEFQKALPLQSSNDYTLYRGDGQTFAYRYQSVGNTVLGQIGEYRGIPLISITASSQAQTLPRAIQKLQSTRNYNELIGNIFISNDQNQVSSFSSRPLNGEDDSSHPSWISAIIRIWEKVIRFAESYRTPILWSLGAFIFIVIGKYVFVNRKK